jgi:hypothetical protein
MDEVKANARGGILSCLLRDEALPGIRAKTNKTFFREAKKYTAP